MKKLLCLLIGHRAVSEDPGEPPAGRDLAESMRLLQAWLLKPVRLHCARCGRTWS